MPDIDTRFWRIFPFRGARALRAWCWLLWIFPAGPRIVSGETAAASPAGPGNSGSADGVTRTIQGRNATFEAPADRVILPPLLTDSLTAGLKEATEWLGIESAFTYNALAAGAINDHSDRGAMSGDATLNLHWRLNRKNDSRPLEIAARVRSRETLDGGLAPSELRAATGALWGYAHGYTGAGWEVPDFYLEQHFFQDRLLARYGQMSIDDLLDDYSARSAKTAFLNEAFAGSPAVGLPGTGLGIVSRWTSPRGWDLTLAASNVQSTSLNDEADWTFKTDNLFEAVQLGYRFEGIRDLPARLQVLAWNADALPAFDLASGRGGSLTLEQEWAGNTNSWVRCAWADGEAAKASWIVTAGFSRAMGKSGRDRLGIAAAAGQAADESGRWQQSLEVFYRWQAGPVQITPDIQLNAGDNIGGDSDWLLLAGLRIGITF